MDFPGNITRRGLLLLGKRLLFFIAGWQFLNWPRQVHCNEKVHFHLADLIGYLLYENNPPSQLREEIGKHLQKIISSRVEEQLEQGIFGKLDIRNFGNLLPEDKKIVVKQALPELLQCQEIIDIIDNLLQGDRVLQYLDYPDLPGEFGECGWLVLEGSVWDRYYPPASG